MARLLIRLLVYYCLGLTLFGCLIFVLKWIGNSDTILDGVLMMLGGLLVAAGMWSFRHPEDRDE